MIQIIVVLIPPVANIFELTELNQTQWLITIVISILPIPIMELQKKLNKSHTKENEIKAIRVNKEHI